MHEANQKNPTTREESKRSMLIIRRAVKKMPRSCHVILAEPCITSIAQLCLAEIKPSNEKDEINVSSFAYQDASRSQEAVQKKTSQDKKQPNERRPARAKKIRSKAFKLLVRNAMHTST